jgi:hypothetical protein
MLQAPRVFLRRMAWSLSFTRVTTSSAWACRRHLPQDLLKPRFIAGGKPLVLAARLIASPR